MPLLPTLRFLDPLSITIEVLLGDSSGLGDERALAGRPAGVATLLWPSFRKVLWGDLVGVVAVLASCD